MNLTCFKAYDIRGQLGDELNIDIAYRIGRAYAQFIKPKVVVVGGDIRHTSITLKMALASGLRDEGVDVLDIGLCGTEEIYFATSHLQVDGGIVVTASHNPIDYNGMKLVREQSRPVSGDTGLNDIKRLAEQGFSAPATQLKKGLYRRVSSFDAYLEHLLSYVDNAGLKPLKLVVNAGNGTAGPVIDGLERHLPFEFIKVHHEPDGSFPHGIPNPLLPENRAATSQAVIEHKADMGIAWDGDFDRCFLFDERGNFIEGYYIVGLLASSFLRKENDNAAPARIIHDPRLTWNTINICNELGGKAVQSKTGHAFIKERMREEDAVYGGEMSAHHYFRDFFYCDSGMIPWLLITELLSVSGSPLSQLVAERIAKYPCSGEINRRVDDAEKALSAIEQAYKPDALKTDYTDGCSMEFETWRFNLRKSNTEPVIRLNVEALDKQTCDDRTKEILAAL